MGGVIQHSIRQLTIPPIVILCVADSDGQYLTSIMLDEKSKMIMHLLLVNFPKVTLFLFEWKNTHVYYPIVVGSHSVFQF